MTNFVHAFESITFFQDVLNERNVLFHSVHPTRFRPPAGMAGVGVTVLERFFPPFDVFFPF